MAISGRWLGVVGTVVCLWWVLPADAAPLAVVVSTGAVAAPGGAGGAIGDLALRYPLSEHWGLALTGRSGWLHGTAGCGSGSCSDQLQLAILIGATGQRSWGQRQLHISAQVAHVHHTAVAAWQMRPLANLAGDSSGSVQHRSGGELSVGLTSAPLLRGDRWGLAVETAVSGSVLPSSAQFSWAAGIKLGVALVDLGAIRSQGAVLGVN